MLSVPQQGRAKRLTDALVAPAFAVLDDGRDRHLLDGLDGIDDALPELTLPSAG